MTAPYRGIDHIGVAVKDLNAAVATYRDMLGFTVSGRETIEARGLEVAFVETGTGRIELIAPTRPDSEVSGFLEKRGEGLHHCCVRVANIESTLADLKARGARLIDERPRPGAHDTKVAFVHPKGSNGVLLELVEHQH